MKVFQYTYYCCFNVQSGLFLLFVGATDYVHFTIFANQFCSCLRADEIEVVSP